MDTDKLSRITRRAYLLDLAIAGLEADAMHSTPSDPQRHYEPVRELAYEIYTALHDELKAARETDDKRLRAAR
jgi:hypothetical protein